MIVAQSVTQLGDFKPMSIFYTEIRRNAGMNSGVSQLGYMIFLNLGNQESPALDDTDWSSLGVVVLV